MGFLLTGIFALAEVRKAARKGKVDSGELDIVSTPVAAGSILKIFQRNLQFFQSYLKVTDYDFMVSLVKNTDVEDINKADINVSASAADGDQDYRKKSLALVNSVSIEYFGDDNAKSECLYMITRNPRNKRIALIFRGSTTLQDWVKDSKLVVTEIENPVSDRPDQLPMIGVHLGFREYLYGESKSLIDSSNSIMKNNDESTATHNLKRQSTTMVTDHDENIEILIDSDHAEKDAQESTSKINIDLSKEDGDDVVTRESSSEIMKIKQEYQKSTTDLLNYLGLDLLAIKEKQKNLRSSMNWSVLPSLRSNENEKSLNKTKNSSDFFAKFASSKSRSKGQSRLARILDEIEQLEKQYDQYNLYVTGHSLGGALGLLAALEIAARFGKKERPVTFVGVANPRAGTEVSSMYIRSD